MLSALKKAFSDVFKRRLRGLLWATVGVTVVLFGLIFFGFSELSSYWQIKDMPVVSTVINVLGTLVFFILALLLFPAVATFVAGFFMDTVVERMAAEGKKQELRTVPLAKSMEISGVAAIKRCCASAVLAPLSLIPAFGFVFAALLYLFNGRQFAREYFFTVALRYQDYQTAENMFEQNKNHWTKAGIIIALLMTVPVVNMISPLVAAAFMQNLFLEKRKEAEKS